MYGGKIKCKDQLKTDENFLRACDSLFTNKKEASEYYIKRGWQFFYKNILDTSMMRFNQAWLLDKTNSETYWGFGNILGKQKKYKESIGYFNKSIQINPKNSKVWECASISYGQIFYDTKDIKKLDTCIIYLKNAIQIDPKNVKAYAQLTASYYYFSQKDSAKKYLKITDEMDINAINPNLRKALSEN